MPAIAQAHSATDGGPAVAPDQYRDMGPLHRFGAEGHAREASVFPGKTGILLRPEFFHDGDGFIGDGTPLGIGTPIASDSGGTAPTPTPKISRPLLSTSRVAAVLASRIGLWYGSTSTEVPKPTRSVRAAHS